MNEVTGDVVQALASYTQIVEWMKKNGVRRIHTGTMEIEREGDFTALLSEPIAVASGPLPSTGV